MTAHYDEEAEIEKVRKWLRENWFPLASGLALGLAAIFGWQSWTQHRDAHAGSASHIYADLEQAAAANKYDDAKAMADRLVKDFSDTPYAAAGALQLAKLAVAGDKLDEAAVRLRWVVEFEQNPGFLTRVGTLLRLHGNAFDPALLPLAKLRLAQVIWQQNKSAEALQQLEGDPGAYAALYAELRGDIKLSQGDRAAARNAYQEALQSLGPNSVGRDDLQRKLADLADAATVRS